MLCLRLGGHEDVREPGCHCLTGPSPVLVIDLKSGIWAHLLSLWSVLGSFKPLHCQDSSSLCPLLLQGE